MQDTETVTAQGAVHKVVAVATATVETITTGIAKDTGTAATVTEESETETGTETGTENVIEMETEVLFTAQLPAEM